MTGHSNIKEILCKVKKITFWDVIIKDIDKYVLECKVCQRKRSNRKLEIKQEISRSEKIWRKVFMNYIIKLSRSKEKNFILIIKNQCNEMIHLKVVKETQTVKKVWQDYWDTTWKLHGLSRTIRTDRKTVFTSKTWKEQIKNEGIEHQKTTTYHSQVNGLVKRVNQEIKRYLRKFVSHNQDD